MYQNFRMYVCMLTRNLGVGNSKVADFKCICFAMDCESRQAEKDPGPYGRAKTCKMDRWMPKRLWVRFCVRMVKDRKDIYNLHMYTNILVGFYIVIHFLGLPLLRIERWSKRRTIQQFLTNRGIQRCCFCWR